MIDWLVVVIYTALSTVLGPVTAVVLILCLVIGVIGFATNSFLDWLEL